MRAHGSKAAGAPEFRVECRTQTDDRIAPVGSVDVGEAQAGAFHHGARFDLIGHPVEFARFTEHQPGFLRGAGIVVLIEAKSDAAHLGWDKIAGLDYRAEARRRE